MLYKLCKVSENRARDAPLRGVYIPHFGKICVKISVLGSYTLVVAPMINQPMRVDELCEMGHSVDRPHISFY